MSLMEQITALLTREAPVKWVFAGDSITHGAAHTIGWRDYTELFSERVRWELGRPRDMVIKTGISGWTVEALLADLDWNILQFRPDCVSLMFGMNDCTRGPDAIPAFIQHYTSVIEQIRDKTGALPLLHTPNSILDFVDGNRPAFLPAYADAILHLGERLQVPVIDHFTQWSSQEQLYTRHHWLVDGFHPNEYGHRAFAESLFHALGIHDVASWVCQLPIPRYR